MLLFNNGDLKGCENYNRCQIASNMYDVLLALKNVYKVGNLKKLHKLDCVCPTTQCDISCAMNLPHRRLQASTLFYFIFIKKNTLFFYKI